MKTLILKSNHGNHNGFNRIWTIENRLDCDLIEARQELAKIADYVSEKHNLSEKERDGLYDKLNDSFDYDGTYYAIITQGDYENGIFDGGHYGYANSDIFNYFEE